MGEEFIKLISDAFSNTEEFTAIEESEFMTDREKEVVLMYYRDKKSPTEIAVDLELSRQRIHQLRNSALVGVRTTLSMVCMPDVKRREFYTTVTEFEDLSNQSKNALMRNKITTPSDIIDYIKKAKRGCARRSNYEITQHWKKISRRNMWIFKSKKAADIS